MFCLPQMCLSQRQAHIRGFSAALVTLTTSKLLESNQTEAFLCIHFMPQTRFHNPVHNKMPFLMSQD